MDKAEGRNTIFSIFTNRRRGNKKADKNKAKGWFKREISDNPYISPPVFTNRTSELDDLGRKGGYYELD